MLGDGRRRWFGCRWWLLPPRVESGSARIIKQCSAVGRSGWWGWMPAPGKRPSSQGTVIQKLRCSWFSPCLACWLGLQRPCPGMKSQHVLWTEYLVLTEGINGAPHDHTTKIIRTSPWVFCSFLPSLSLSVFRCNPASGPMKTQFVHKQNGQVRLFALLDEEMHQPAFARFWKGNLWGPGSASRLIPCVPECPR